MNYSLFDFVKVMFTNPKDYAEVRNSEKAKHYFMLQRFFAIKFPTTAQQLNRVGINGWAVVDLWNIVAQRFKGRVPGWIYTKLDKNNTKVVKTWKPDPELAKLYLKRTGMTQRDLDDCIKFYPDETKKFFNVLEKQMKES